MIQTETVCTSRCLNRTDNRRVHCPRLIRGRSRGGQPGLHRLVRSMPCSQFGSGKRCTGRPGLIDPAPVYRCLETHLGHELQLPCRAFVCGHLAELT
jgi:hypothetical protein